MISRSFSLLVTVQILKKIITGWIINSIKISTEYLKILYWFMRNLPLLDTGHFSLKILIPEKKSWWHSLSLRNASILQIINYVLI